LAGGAGVGGEGGLAFIGTLKRRTGVPAVGRTNNEGVWETSSGALSLVVRKGQTIGSQIKKFSRNELLHSANGETAVKVTLIGAGVDTSNNEAVWSSLGGGTMVVRDGDTPTDETGAEVSDGSVIKTIQQIAGNGNGDVAYTAILDGGASGTNQGLWYYDASTSKTSKLLRKGDILTIDETDYTVSKTTIVKAASGGRDGHARAMNDAGEVAAQVTLSDGEQGVFLLNPSD
jgi:hypothetical protein